MTDKRGEIYESNSFRESTEINNPDAFSSHDYTGGRVGSMQPPSSILSTSKVFGEQVFESTSTGSGSTLVFEGSSRCLEADRQLSYGTTEKWPTPMKRDIRTEIGLALRNGSLEMDAKKEGGYHINAAEKGCYRVEHDSQHRTESSCSNSLSVVLPVSSQEFSNGAHSLKKCGGSMDNSDSKSSDLRSEETVTASSESGVSAQIARKAIRNARSRNNEKISSMVESHNSLLTEKENSLRQDEETSHEWGGAVEPMEMYKLVSVLGNSFSTRGQHGGTTGKSLVCSGNSDHFNCSSNTEVNIRSCTEQDVHPSFYSGERMISSEISGESENMLAAEQKPLGSCLEEMDKTKCGFLKNESFDSSMNKYGKEALKDHCTFVAGFDLNEDINTDGMDDLIQPVVENMSCQSVIRVVAKAGIPRGFPTTLLKFAGALGWKGSSETSAFRPAVLSKSLNPKTSSISYCPTNPQSFTGIDLNIAYGEDDASNGLQDSSSKVGSQRTESLNIDLNCLYDAAEEFTQPSLPRESKNSSMMDLNLNGNTLVGDEVKNAHWLHRGCPPMENKTWDSENKLKRDYNFTNDSYLADLRQQSSNHAHVQQYMVAAPHILQSLDMMQRVGPFPPNLPFLSHALPPHTYPSNGPFPFSSRGPLPSNIHYSSSIPYARYSQENGSVHEVSNNAMVNSSLGAPHSNIAISSAKIDAKTEDYLSSCGSSMDDARQFPFHTKSSLTDEQMKSLHQEAWYATSTKRKEPEGGLEYYQLGYRQVT